MCEFKSGVSVKLNEYEVDTKTVPLVDSHTAIRKKHGIIESDDSLRSSRSTPVELIPQTNPPNFEDSSKWTFVFDSGRPDWWTDTMTEQASRQLLQAAKDDWNNHNEKDHLEAIQQGTFTTLRNIQKPSLKVQQAAVKKDGRAIQFVKKPSEDMQVTAVRQYGWAVKYIEKPSLKVKMTAVRQDGYVIQYIKNPSVAMQLAVVKKDGLVIRHIAKPSLAVQMAAVRQYGGAIGYIENPSLKVQLAAVRKTPRAINGIKNPSHEVRKAAGL